MRFPAFPGMVKNRSRAEINSFIGTMQAAGLDPINVATVIEFESAGSWSPSIQNAGSQAVGLIQFIPSTAKLLGTTTDELARMSFARQLSWVVKYFDRQGMGRLKRLVDIYAAVFWPPAIGTANEYLIAKAGNPVYEQNKALDPRGTGQITTGDLDSVMQGVLAKANANGTIEVTSTNPGIGSPALAIGLGFLGLAAIGGLAVYKLRKAKR